MFTLDKLQRKLAQKQFDKQHFSIVVDLPGGKSVDIVGVSLDLENEKLRCQAEGFTAADEDEDFEAPAEAEPPILDENTKIENDANDFSKNYGKWPRRQ